MKPTIAAIVLTYNEERHLSDCLASLTWCDEVWVVDSHSTDATLEIAQQYTDSILQHPFDNFSAQRNWALDNIHTEADWVLMVDADERATPELATEIRQRLEADNNRYGGYYVPRKQYFWGRWLRHGEAWPNYNLRLFRRGAGHYIDREVHENLRVEGNTTFLRQPLIHLPTETMQHALNRLNWYTSLEALRMYRTGQHLYSPAAPSYARRNQLLKRVFQKLPAKPIAKFVYEYILRQGFRDGHQGFAWATLQGIYVWVSYFKLWELRAGLVTPQQLQQLQQRSPATSGQPTAKTPSP